MIGNGCAACRPHPNQAFHMMCVFCIEAEVVCVCIDRSIDRNKQIMDGEICSVRRIYAARWKHRYGVSVWDYVTGDGGANLVPVWWQR